MHGIIFCELRRYVEQTLGVPAWPALLNTAGLPERLYVPGPQYPDAELTTLVSTAVQVTGRPAAAILEDFGEFIVPALFTTYGPLVEPEWRTLDLLEHTEETIHRVVRLRNPDAAPPQIQCTRRHATEVVITYTSSRKLCALAKGIVRGVAKHYQETVVLTDLTCMLAGARECQISVTLAR